MHQKYKILKAAAKTSIEVDNNLQASLARALLFEDGAANDRWDVVSIETLTDLRADFYEQLLDLDDLITDVIDKINDKIEELAALEDLPE